MASASKSTPATSAPRRKSSGPKEKKTLIVTLKLSPEKLRGIGKTLIKEDASSKKSTSTIPSTIPIATSQNGDPPAEPIPNTPAPNSTATPVPSSMPPPTEAIKKKSGVKRSSAALGSDTTPRVRGKPGPKKKARLDDGTIDPITNTPRAPNANGTSHKLGPKANQGAINAGTEGSQTSDSSKENKDNSQIESEKSNSAMNIDHNTNLASSPVPQTQAQAQAQAQAQPEPEPQPSVVTATV
ncbi:hypothetical protein SBOR_7935 [Sclerotinia borealis F-4128]|uniref:Uncharacterized protein n=1 Tax=Sclerotinia borealis (strain F-4128) TaxID=1432307 RepID=W9C7E1_SCLBF|nr:hypothetical protein SBOR_7935 [Sclerotinia borealis F-4128]